jgi:hypothetical protein
MRTDGTAAVMLLLLLLLLLQIWRLFTCFFSFGKINMGWIITLYMLSADSTALTAASPVLCTVSLTCFFLSLVVCVAVSTSARWR